MPPRDKKRHSTRSDRQGGNVLGCTGRSACRLGTKNAILRVLTVKAATFWAVLAVLPAASGQKNAILRVLTVKAAMFWASWPFCLPPRDKKRHSTRSDRQGGNDLGFPGHSVCRLGTKNAVIRVLAVKAATFWAFQAVLPAASGQKTPFYAF